MEKIPKWLNQRGLLFTLYFYIEALKGIFSFKQNIIFPKNKLYKDAIYSHNKKVVVDWHNLFGISGIVDSKLSYFWHAPEIGFLTAMNRLGFKYKNVLHLGHKRVYSKKLSIDEKYDIKMCIDDIVVHSENRIVFLMRTDLFDSTFKLVTSSTDTIFVKNIDNKFLKKLEKSNTFGRSDISMYQQISKREADLKRYSKIFEYYVPSDMGLAYGRISGDLNPVHTSKVSAKVFGFKRPFLQGVCTANIVMKFLNTICEPSEFSICFCKPLFLDSHIQICIADSKFEVIDADGKLLSFGSYKSA